jgi:hypothetical protein
MAGRDGYEKVTSSKATRPAERPGSATGFAGGADHRFRGEDLEEALGSAGGALQLAVHLGEHEGGVGHHDGIEDEGGEGFPR